MNRRSLLKAMAFAPLANVCGVLSAAPVAQAKLLLVFLRGGYDAANLLIPIGNDFYYEARPHIGVPPPNLSKNSAINLDGEWALHPAFRNTLQPLFERNEVAFIPFAGTHDWSRSHFATQDTIELGQPLNDHRNFQSGFLNRLVSTLNDASPMSFTDQLPLTFRGQRQIPNTNLWSLTGTTISEGESAVISEMYSDTLLKSQVDEGFNIRKKISTEMESEMLRASRSAITPKGFELEARRIAQLMKHAFNIGFVDVGGWDTHFAYGGAAGYLAQRFEELGRGLVAFANEMGNAWHDTVVVVLSEFGRAFRENGSHGTDHGHGSVYWVMGGNIHGGRVVGERVLIHPDTLFQDRDYPVLNEYRALLAGLFRRMFGLTAAQLEQVFPAIRPTDFGLI